jgi:3-oxoacyl-[acyl-carrier protein] reductase
MSAAAAPAPTPTAASNPGGTPRRALVTGASGAIGSAIARRLARNGAHVVVHANGRLDAAQQLAAELTAAGGSAEAAAFDVTDRAATHAALLALLEGGAIQVLVNNAGVHDDAVFPAMRRHNGTTLSTCR